MAQENDTTALRNDDLDQFAEPNQEISLKAECVAPTEMEVVRDEDQVPFAGGAYEPELVESHSMPGYERSPVSSNNAPANVPQTSAERGEIGSNLSKNPLINTSAEPRAYSDTAKFNQQSEPDLQKKGAQETPADKPLINDGSDLPTLSLINLTDTALISAHPASAFPTSPPCAADDGENEPISAVDSRSLSAPISSRPTAADARSVAGLLSPLLVSGVLTEFMEAGMAPSRDRNDCGDDSDIADLSGEEIEKAKGDQFELRVVETDPHQDTVDSYQDPTGKDHQQDPSTEDAFQDLVTAYLHQDPVTSDLHQDPVTADLHQDPVTADLHQDPVTSDLHQDPVTADLHQDLVTADLHQDPVTADLHQDPVTSDLHQDPVTTDLHQDPVTSEPPSGPGHNRPPSGPSHSPTSIRTRSQQTSIRTRSQQTSIRTRSHPTSIRNPVTADLHQDPVTSDLHQ